MVKWIVLIPLALTALATVTALCPSTCLAQCDIAVESYASARDNALESNSWANFVVPAGSSVTVTASGTAWAGPGREFGAVLVGYPAESPRRSAHRALPKGGVLEIAGISGSAGGNMDCWFADDDASDNSGHFVLSFQIEGGGSPTELVVDPSVHWFCDDRAAVVELPSVVVCTVEATGSGAYAGPNQYRSVMLSYLSDATVPPSLMYACVDTGVGPMPLGGLATSEIRLFFSDTYAGDNTGGFDVQFLLEEPVPTPDHSWGSIKTLFE